MNFTHLSAWNVNLAFDRRFLLILSKMANSENYGSGHPCFWLAFSAVVIAPLSISVGVSEASYGVSKYSIFSDRITLKCSKACIQILAVNASPTDVELATVSVSCYFLT